MALLRYLSVGAFPTVLLLASGCSKDEGGQSAAESDTTSASDSDSAPTETEPSVGDDSEDTDSAASIDSSVDGQAGNTATTPALSAAGGQAGNSSTGTSNSGGGDTAGVGGTSSLPLGGSGGMPVDDAGVAGSDVGPATGGSPAVEPEPIPVGEPVAVAVGYGMRRVSSRNGLDWEYFQELVPDGGDDNNLFRGLAFGGGRFVAVGGSSTSISMFSLDGQTWQAEDRAQDAWMGGVAWLNGEFVVAGGNGLRVHSEDLGTSWLEPVGYQAIHYRDVAAGNGVVVAVGHTYGEMPDVGIIAVTNDGREWSEVGRSGESLSRVAFGNGAFVTAGANGRVSRSSDGAMWDDQVVGSGGGGVVFVNDEFVLSNSGGVFRSGDGSAWVPVAGASLAVEGYIGGYYLALDWPARIHASSDMVEWSVVFDPAGSGFTRIVTGYVE